MKLQSQVSREYKGTKYEKFWVVVPSKTIKKLGWKGGDDLEFELNNGKLTLESVKHSLFVINEKNKTIVSLPLDNKDQFVENSKLSHKKTKSQKIKLEIVKGKSKKEVYYSDEKEVRRILEKASFRNVDFKNF